MADTTTYNGLVASSVPVDPNVAAGGGTGVSSGSSSGGASAASAAPAAAAQPAAAAPVAAAPVAQSAAAAPQVSPQQAAAASQAEMASQAISAAPPPFEQWQKSQSDTMKSAIKASAQQYGVSEESVARSVYDGQFATGHMGFMRPAETMHGTPVIWGGPEPAAAVSPIIASNPLAAKQVRSISVGPDTQTDPITGLPLVSPAMLAEQYGMQQAPTMLKRGMGYDPSAPDQNAAIKQVQTQLARAGYYHNGIDGLYGPITERAVAKYRADNDLGAGKTIDNTVLAHLETNFPVGGVPTPQERPYNGPLPTARPAQPGDNALVAQSRPADLNPANRLYGGAGGATMTADDQIAAAQASPANELGAPLMPAARTAVPTVAEIRAANPVPTELAPAPAPDTSLPSTFTPGAVAAGDYGIDIRQPAGLASNSRGIASDGSRMATPEQMRAAAARAAAAQAAPGAPVAEPAAAVTVAPIVPAAAGKEQGRVPAVMGGPESKVTPAPAEIFVPRVKPRPMSGDLAGLPQVASLETGSAAYTPPYVSPEWERLMNPAPMTDAIAPTSTTGMPGADTPMGVRIPADKPAPPPSTGSSRAPQPASVAQLNQPIFYSPETYVAMQPGQLYYDPQGNLRQKAGGQRMAA